jgi:hypothetical protein
MCERNSWETLRTFLYLLKTPLQMMGRNLQKRQTYREYYTFLPWIKSVMKDESDGSNTTADYELKYEAHKNKGHVVFLLLTCAEVVEG